MKKQSMFLVPPVGDTTEHNRPFKRWDLAGGSETFGLFSAVVEPTMARWCGHRAAAYMAGKGWQPEHGQLATLNFQSRSTEMNPGVELLSIQPGTPSHEMVPPTFKMGLLTLLNPV